ncbi:MAG: hypothetical protein HEQ23_05500 [Tepidisphaera sp.]
MRTKNVALVSLIAAVAGTAAAQPLTPPVYTRTVQDAITGDNDFIAGGFRYYTVDAGADSYQNDLYERPMTQAFQPITLPSGEVRYACEEYHGYVDIVQGRFGYDNRYLYASIKVAGLTKNTKDGDNAIVGLDAAYSVRFGPDPDGRNSVILRALTPQGTVFAREQTDGYRDTDADVGGRGGPIHGRQGPSGLSVTKDNNNLEEQGLNGYDQQFITSDGLFETLSQVVLWQRISPTDPTVVEIAFDYVTAGYTRADLDAIRYLQFDAVLGGPSDPVEALWNDKYRSIEAGSPNPGLGTDSEFGTQGLGTISLADTARASIPAPCAADFNRDGFLDFFDYDAFVLAFETGGVGADFNGDGFVDFFDYDAFVLSFELGC